MAKGDQIGSAFGGRNARDLGHTQDIAFGHGLLPQEFKCGGGEVDFSFGPGPPVLKRFVPYVDHACTALGIQMAEIGHFILRLFA
jgi:hypothetical protein